MDLAEHLCTHSIYNYTKYYRLVQIRENRVNDTIFKFKLVSSQYKTLF